MTTSVPRVALGEGFCTKCGQRVTIPTSTRHCDHSPDCGPFRQESVIADDVLNHTQQGWRSPST